MEHQLKLFAISKMEMASSQKPKLSSSKKNNWEIFIDGASRGNPGPAGAGIRILKNDQIVSSHSVYLGKKTNNQAEYLALALSLFFLRKDIASEKSVPKEIRITSDSELLVRQMNGIYKIKNDFLIELQKLIQELLDGIKCSFRHVERAKNSEADELANKAVDKKIKIPVAFTKLLEKHNIKI